MNDTIIIIPTYNARGSIVQSIRNIQAVVPDATILIVDDNSPDGTAGLVVSTFKKDKKVKVLERSGKQGRGSAVIAGLREGLKEKKLHYFIEMDADLCHDPKYIPELVKKCHISDIVIASKYLPNSTIAGLTFKRKLMSRLMNVGARFILQVPITDYSNGYRCYNKSVADFLTKQKFTARGFVVLSEIVYRCYKKGFTIAEIPFNFKQIAQGQSNFNSKEVKEAIRTLLRLRFEK